MSNFLVSGLRWSEWTFQRLVFTSISVYLVLQGIIRFLYKKPWGAQATCRKAIEKNNKVRAEGFTDFHSRVHTSSDEVIEKRKQILSWSFLELRDRLQRDEITAVQTLESYVWKAMQLQERYNCCIEVIREAFDTAAEADKLWSGAVEKPPLYGIPFSVKGNFYMSGYDCTMGLAKFLEQPKLVECSMVTHLRNLGAVPFVITNVPQALLSFACSSSVYGTTANPLDVTRSPGGSSGGEAALLAAGGTPFATGSDLAGSLRIPAAFCGLVTLKPCQDRLVVKNSHGGVPGRGRLGLSFGFFTHTVAEQVELLRTIIGHPAYIELVPTSVPLPLNEQEISRAAKMRIGYYDDDGFCPAVPCVKRALLETVELLKREGHELIRFKIPNVDEMVDILYKVLMPDGGRYVLSLYDNDIVDPYMKEFVALLKIPRFLRYLASYILKPISPQMSALCAAYVSSLEDLRYTQELCDDYKDKFIACWKNLGVDALICPTFPVPAVPHRYPSRITLAVTYASLYNLLDFPAGAVPVGMVSPQDDLDLLDESKYPVGHNIALRFIREASMNSAGLPLSVQVVTLPYEEEKCLRLMAEVERVWKGVSNVGDLIEISK